MINGFLTELIEQFSCVIMTEDCNYSEPKGFRIIIKEACRRELIWGYI